MRDVVKFSIVVNADKMLSLLLSSRHRRPFAFPEQSLVLLFCE